MILGKEYQPVVTYGIPSIRDGEATYEMFWSEQRDRIDNGYTPTGGTRISGLYYFYLNFGTIMGFAKPTDTVKIAMKPHYRDGDHEFFMEIEKAQTAEQVYGLIVGKARRRGYTWMMVHVILYAFMKMANVELAVGSQGEPDQGYVADWKVKFFLALSHLPKELRPQIEGIDNKDKLETCYLEPVGKKKHKIGLMGLIHWVNFAKPGVLRGKSLFHGIWEEFGQVKYGQKSYLATWDCFKEGSFQFAVPIIGGTSDKIEHDNDDFRTMFNEPERFNLKKIFLDSTTCYYPFYSVETGISDRSAAREKIENELAILKKGDDSTAYWSFKNQWPIHEEDMWIVYGGTVYPIDLINDQIAYLSASKKAVSDIKTGIFKWDKKKPGQKNPDVIFVEETGGPWQMWGEPMTHLENLNMIGLDPYFLDDDLIDGEVASDSKGAIVVYRRFHPGIESNCVMAVYHDRPYKKKLFHDQALMASIYYNGKVLAETGDDQLFTHFIDQGFMKNLKERPLVAESPFSKAENRYGVSMKDYQKHLLEDLTDDDLKENISNHKFVHLLRELAVYGSKNTDIAMAYGIALIQAYDYRNVLVAEKDAEETRKYLVRPEFEQRGEEMNFRPPSVGATSTDDSHSSWLKRLNNI